MSSARFVALVSRVNNKDNLRFRIALIDPAVRQVRLEHNAVARFKRVDLPVNRVANASAQAVYKFMPGVHDQVIPTAHPRRKCNHKRLYGISSQILA